MRPVEKDYDAFLDRYTHSNAYTHFARRTTNRQYSFLIFLGWHLSEKSGIVYILGSE